ncbi:MAG: hypothetical protein LWX83_12005, partial [Anaerolineae bacterium]|nr:hypothetical protein [Anaerolineae bacterium]
MNTSFPFIAIMIGLLMAGCSGNEVPKTTISSTIFSVTSTPIKLPGEVIESQTPAFEKKNITATVFPFPSQTVTPTVAQNATKMPTLPAIEA